MRRYTCMHCNKGWSVDDPGFVYWRRPTSGRWAGQNLDGRDGRPRDSIGWFAHCADAQACAARRRNVHAGVAPEQLAIGDAAYA